jgi:hypothetical protein
MLYYVLRYNSIYEFRLVNIYAAKIQGFLHTGFIYYSLKTSVSMILLHGKENLCCSGIKRKAQRDSR